MNGIAFADYIRREWMRMDQFYIFHPLSATWVVLIEHWFWIRLRLNTVNINALIASKLDQYQYSISILNTTVDSYKRLLNMCAVVRVEKTSGISS